MRWSIDFDTCSVPVAASDDLSRCAVILAHGAGSSMEHATLAALVKVVEAAGARSVRFNFCYRAQGKSLPDRMPQLISTYAAVVESVRQKLAPERLVIGGHSMGGRVASMLLAEQPEAADGLLLFGYPLHPPRKPEQLRAAHLAQIRPPVLCFNGTRDELCTKELMDQTIGSLANWRMRWLEGADHSYKVSASSGTSRTALLADMEAAVRDWISTEILPC